MEPVYVSFPQFEDVPDAAPHQRVLAIGRRLQNMIRAGELNELDEDTRGEIGMMYIELMVVGRDLTPPHPTVVRLLAPPLTLHHGGDAASSERTSVLRLQECVSECLTSVVISIPSSAISGYGDIVDAIRDAGRVVLLIESLENAAHMSKERLRRTLAEVMDEGGIPSIATETHVISAYQGSPRVVIMDDAAIPETYYVQDAPKLSREMVARALKAGTNIPGATLNNGGPVLRIAQRKR